MTNPLKTAAASNLFLFLSRLALGALFFLYGLEKFQHYGLKGFVKASTGDIPSFLPQPIGQTYLYLVPFAEIIVGLALVLGFFTRTAAVLASLMLISYTIAVTGVFTKGDPDWYWYHVNFNIVYLGLALVLTTTGAGAISLDRAIFGSDHSPRH